MKKILFIIALSIVFVSCKKSDISIKNVTDSWELAREIGMDRNQTFAPGSGNLLKLNADKTYSRFTNHQQVSSGTYYLGTVAAKGTKAFDVIYFSEYSGPTKIRTSADSLILSTPPNDANGNMIMDGGTSIYIRQK